MVSEAMPPTEVKESRRPEVAVDEFNPPLEKLGLQVPQ